MSKAKQDESQQVDEPAEAADQLVDQPHPSPESSAAAQSLRIWPAILLLALLAAFKYVPPLLPEMTIPLIFTWFLGPAICAGLILLWWVFFSRASRPERWLGLLILIVMGGIAYVAADETMQGFGVIAHFIPWGVGAFTVTLILAFSLQSPLRTVLALLAAVAGFGYWDLVRADEFRGDFATTFNWRWEPTAEEQFLKQLASRPDDGATVAPDEIAEPLGEPEWPGFRGPNRDSILPGVVLAEDWQAQPPQEIWKQPIGPGWSSFAVAGERLFTQEQRGDYEMVVCYDAKSGAEVWTYQDKTRFWEVIGGAGPRATPTLANGKLYAMGANGILNCLDPMTGDKIWTADIRKDASREPPVWGFSSSPLVTHGVVIVHAGGKDGKGILAYDAASGEMRWSAPAGNDTYSSPHLATIDGKECVLMLTNKGISFTDPADGTPLGKHAWEYQAYRVVQPLVVGDSSVLLGTNMGTGTQRVDASWGGKQFATTTDWTSKRMSPYYNDYVLHKDHLYGFDNNIFACIELTKGERKWKRGRYGNGQVLLLPDADQLLVISESGELVLLRATPEKHLELAKHQAINGRTWNHHVLVGNRVYVRNGEEAACLELTLMEASESNE